MRMADTISSGIHFNIWKYVRNTNQQEVTVEKQYGCISTKGHGSGQLKLKQRAVCSFNYRYDLINSLVCCLNQQDALYSFLQNRLAESYLRQNESFAAPEDLSLIYVSRNASLYFIRKTALYPLASKAGFNSSRPLSKAMISKHLPYHYNIIPGRCSYYAVFYSAPLTSFSSEGFSIASSSS